MLRFSRRVAFALSLGALFLFASCSGGEGGSNSIPSTQARSVQSDTTDTNGSVLSTQTGVQSVSNVSASSGGVSGFAATACATSTPCAGGNNTGTGAGVLGESKSSHGVIGQTLFNSTTASTGESAIYGQDLSTSGAYNMGIQGSSTRGYGVRGRSTSNSGVRGDSSSGAGLYGSGPSGYGVYGLGVIALYGQGSSYGVYALGGPYGVVASGTSVGVYTSSSSGDALNASTSATSHWAINAQAPNGSGMQLSGSGRGSDTTGGSIGVVARSTNFPLLAALPNGTDLFWIDSAGNVNYTGSLIKRAAARASSVQTSSTLATTPAIEETGTARLVDGTAHVNLSSSLARSIDARLGYQVFLTPGGDTRGLYVATKNASGFTVREVQRGRGTLNFDYHVYAHITESAAVQAQAAPVVPAVTQGMKVPPLPQTQALP